MLTADFYEFMSRRFVLIYTISYLILISVRRAKLFEFLTRIIQIFTKFFSPLIC